MNFGRAQVELQAECPLDIGLQLAEISGKKDICYNAAKKDLKFTVQNGVNIEVTGLLVNVIGSEEAKTMEVNTEIAKGGIQVGHAPYDASVSGELRQVKITPKVVFYDEEQICIEKSVIVENVGGC